MKIKKSGQSLIGNLLRDLAVTLDVEKTGKNLSLTSGEMGVLLERAAGEFSGGGVAVGAVAGAVIGEADDATVSYSGGALVAFVDGASRGNPGVAGAGAILKDDRGGVVKRLRKKLGKATNNVAEYEALIMALEEALVLGSQTLVVYADSELVVKQMKGIYRVKNEGLKPLHSRASALAKKIDSFKIFHVKREKNTDADKLANEAIDGK